MYRVAVLASIVALIFGNASAGEPAGAQTETPSGAIIVPVRCEGSDGYAPSCGVSLNFDEAFNRHGKFLKDRCATSDPCDVGKLLAAVQANVCGEIGTDEPTYVWASPDEVVDGTKAIKDLGKELSDANLTAPGYQVVQEGGSEKNEKKIALCVVNIINGVAGPPSRCSTVSIERKGKFLIRATPSVASLDCSQAVSFSFGRSIVVDYDIDTGLDIKDFSVSITKALEAGLGVQTQGRLTKDRDGQASSYFMMASSPLRESSILGGGWRESIDLNLFVSRIGAGQLTVTANARPLVNRLATGYNEYHGPDDGQVDLYAKAISVAIEGGIKTLCSNGIKIDDKTITCN